MKIILSRKGFDATYGGFPSPVLEDGRMISLPIPIFHDQEKTITYDDLSPQGVNLGSLFNEIGKIPRIGNKEAKYVHFDPDLYEDSLSPDNKFGARLNGWRGLFGTEQAAAGILCNPATGVEEGDIFLFFGWFNHLVRKEGKLGFDPKSQGFHQIWGWMQIDRIINLAQDVDMKSVPKWAMYHPHCHHPEWNPNVMFIARQTLSLDGFDTDGMKGYGAVKHFSPHATLTELDPTKNNEYYNRYQTLIQKPVSPNQDIKTSLWRLPLWFYHEDITKRLGYHNKDNVRTNASWHKDENFAYLKSTSPGQEFVLDMDSYPEIAKKWILQLIDSSKF